MKWKRKKRREQKRIAAEQIQYKKLRNKGHVELDMLEDYFGNSYSDSFSTYKSILYHLQAKQKELSHVGFRGIVIGLLIAILSFVLILSMFSEVGVVFWLQDPFIISGFIIVVLLLVIWGYHNVEKERRNRLYINEYMIALTREKLVHLGE